MSPGKSSSTYSDAEKAAVVGGTGRERVMAAEVGEIKTKEHSGDMRRWAGSGVISISQSLMEHSSV